MIIFFKTMTSSSEGKMKRERIITNGLIQKGLSVSKIVPTTTEKEKKKGEVFAQAVSHHPSADLAKC